MSDAKHYTAVISINRVDKRPPSPSDYGNRDVTEIVRIALKASTIEAMKSNIMAHVDLVDEDGTE